MDEPSTHEPTEPTDRTQRAETADAQRHGAADRMPTPEEEAAAERQPADPGVAEHFEEMAERGANQAGEGRIEP